MPEILRLDPNLYSLRHIRVGNPLNNTATALTGGVAAGEPGDVVGQVDVVSQQLPISDLISSPDVVSGTSTARLGDSGTWQAQFPNKAASDGVPWLSRFTASTGGVTGLRFDAGRGHLSLWGAWKRATTDFESVTVSGHDGFWCLKCALRTGLAVPSSAAGRDEPCLEAADPAADRQFP